MLWSFPKIDPETFGTDWAFPLSYNGKRKKEVSVTSKRKLWHMMITHILRKSLNKCKPFNPVKSWL